MTTRWSWHQTSGSDWIWRPTRMAIYHRDGDRCLSCNSTEELSLDHVRPDGDNSPSNLITLCSSCNSSRGDSDLEDFDPELVLIARRQTRIPLDRAVGQKRARARIEQNRRYRKERRA